EQCNAAGLIEGKHQSIDSTLVKANASLDSLERKEPVLTVKEFIDKSYEENKDQSSDNKDDNNDKDNKPAELKLEKRIKKTKRHKEKDINKKYYSKTDPDSRVASKPRSLKELYYLTHYASDSKNRIITDVFTTYADRKDSKDLMQVYERSAKRLKKLGLIIKEISADKGYCSGENLRRLEECGVTPFIPSPDHPTKGLPKENFIYNEEEDAFLCPNNKKIKFSTYVRESKRYSARRKDCLGCPLKEQCCPGSKMKEINRTIYYKEYERLEQRLIRAEGKRALRIRETVSEGLFAEAKGNHSLKKFMSIGIDNARKKSYLIATVQNLKRLMKLVGRKVKKALQLSRYQVRENIMNIICPNYTSLQVC
ncbi:MAG: hypothetical protein EHM25_14400, partial [Nitrosopumilales archaeon]